MNKINALLKSTAMTDAWPCAPQPLLYGLSTQVSKGWPKIHDGLRKMYEAEVLGKLVVVRGLRVGGLIAWD